MYYFKHREGPILQTPISKGLGVKPLGSHAAGIHALGERHSEPLRLDAPPPAAWDGYAETVAALLAAEADKARRRLWGDLGARRVGTAMAGGARWGSVAGRS